ncbi:hypothetical protein Pfo_013281 [Paulownia fortunei]|nr:hypothetical protein Pfo_013281 [Paulownia fortunei]
MAIFRTVPLLIALTVVCCFLPSPPFLSATAKRIELATQVCRNTTNFAFCRDTIYSDPRAPDADRYVLAYIAFGKAYSNATHTRNYIVSKIKSIEAAGGGKSGILKGLKNCLGYYNEAFRTLSEMLGDLDSESFYELDKLSLDVEGCPRACEKGFHGRSPITKRNDDLIKLANICYVVSKLYEYH